MVRLFEDSSPSSEPRHTKVKEGGNHKLPLLPQVRHPEAEPEVGILVLVPYRRSALRENQEAVEGCQSGQGK